MCLHLDSYLQEKSRLERAHIQSHAVHNQTATMLELGSSLLTHTAEQTRNLNTVEAKVTALTLDPSRFPSVKYGKRVLNQC